MNITPFAKKTLAALIIGNVLIVTAGIVIYQYLLLTTLRPPLTPQMQHNIARFLYRLQSQPESRWPKLITKYHKPWASISVSEKPRFKQQNLKALRPAKGKNQVSIPLRTNRFANIELLNPHLQNNSALIAFTVLGLMWLSALFILCYWAVKRLNNPIRLLMANLTQAKHKKQWQSLAVTTDDEQAIIFEQINALQQQANKTLSERTHLLAAISHDLRTPLTRMKLRLDYLQDNIHHDKLVQDITDMELMISETLDYFRDMNKKEAPQQFDLSALLNALSEDAIDLNYQVTFTTKSPKLIYLGQLNLLKRAFSNILNNAIQYGHSAEITLVAETDNWIINIKDKGQGLPPEQLEKVFSPFVRGESSRSRQTGGTGLGLTIAKEIIQSHNGSLQLHNHPEGGLQAIIKLPITHLA